MAEDDGLPPGLVPEGENDDDIGDDTAALFSIDVGDGSTVLIDLDGDGGEGATRTVNSNSSAPSVAGKGNTGKRKLSVWTDFTKIFEDINDFSTCTKAVCKMCKTTLSARSAAGTSHLKRHQKSCRLKIDQRARVQSRLSSNPDGSVYNWDYKPEVACAELCRLIAKLDLPLGIGETNAWEEYIQRAHNPKFVKVSRQSITRDLAEFFNERRNLIKNCVFPGASSVSLTSDICSSNAKEDYISVVAHYVSADWEFQKKVIALRLIEVKHTSENIAEKVGCVIQEFSLLDKIMSVTLDNASSNASVLLFLGFDNASSNASVLSSVASGPAST
jgi:hypothetical protein